MFTRTIARRCHVNSQMFGTDVTKYGSGNMYIQSSTATPVYKSLRTWWCTIFPTVTVFMMVMVNAGSPIAVRMVDTNWWMCQTNEAACKNIKM